MIRSFKHQLAEDIFRDRVTGASRKFPAMLRKIAKRKLEYLNSAIALADLKQPPGNRMEALKGNLKGNYSIRINDQWRVVFRWENGAFEVEVVDYH